MARIAPRGQLDEPDDQRCALVTSALYGNAISFEARRCVTGNAGSTALPYSVKQHITMRDLLFRVEVPHIYAVGDVIGFPSLASTSMEQGRLAVCHAFGIETHSFPELFPYGIFTIPGMSMVGKTEEQLTQEGVPYEVGRAQYREIARGQILGDQTGMLKPIFHRESRDLLGVHIIGAGAAELFQ
jgi:pyruvate/2-oxoglutarate dehydrogenase complex dihydrolipoamide dehydrogenase (E3) component